MIHIELGLVLVTGPSCGGKSKWAEYLVANQSSVTYLATSASDETDQLWMTKIEMHRNRRPSNWNTIETSFNLPEIITNTNNSEALLVDSLGGYVGHCLEYENDSWEKCVTQFISSINNRSGPIVIVVEEVGWSVVPSTRSGLVFRERLGRLALLVQKYARTSWLVVQGRAINLTQQGYLVP